ncbi:hypothetical protein PHISP_05383 [Aspergillus sp. HF37]|nr:hypothetical protein PHISP_05383 [Aspergillus sp. HF37]
MKSSSTKVPECHGSLYKEVRFSPTVTPIRRTQSVSTSNPASDPDHAPVHSRNPVGETYSALSAVYVQQSRSLLERQRQNFESERAIFAEERQLWERERALLSLRIAELESLLKGRGGSASASNPHHHHPPSQSGASLSAEPTCNGHEANGLNKPTPTRVFQGTQKPDGLVVPISEQGGALSLDAALSPQSRPADLLAAAGVSVPIEKLDSKLDGITLKSSGLPPEIVARVLTPPSPSPLDTSPSVHLPRRPSTERRNSLKLKLSDLGPPDKNRTRDAGHTPMAVIDAGADTEQQPTGESTPPQAPAETEPVRPRENSESYFPDVADAPDDPALKGPLSLLNDEDHDKGFLNELDSKLLDQTSRDVPNASDPKAQVETHAEAPSQGEPEPELKFKNTTNFGTAFGKSSCGEA